MAALSYVNVFARDIEALSGFYRKVFGFPKIEPIRSPIFRGLDAGTCCIGFNAEAAYELLGLGGHADPSGVASLLNIDVASVAEVDAMVPAAQAVDATLIKPPYKTYYDEYQAVLTDPEGNVFRINAIL